MLKYQSRGLLLTEVKLTIRTIGVHFLVVGLVKVRVVVDLALHHPKCERRGLANNTLPVPYRRWPWEGQVPGPAPVCCGHLAGG